MKDSLKQAKKLRDGMDKAGIRPHRDDPNFKSDLAEMHTWWCVQATGCEARRITDHQVSAFVGLAGAR